MQWDELQDADGAARTFASLSAIDTLSVDELDGRAEVLGALGRWQDAFEQREKALELRGDVTRISDWLDLARDQVERAEAPEAAIRACGRALGMDARSTQALELRADLSRGLGRAGDELEDRFASRLRDSSWTAKLPPNFTVAFMLLPPEAPS